MAFFLSNKHQREKYLFQISLKESFLFHLYILKILHQKKTPVIVAKKPIIKPVKKKDLMIEFSDSPSVFIIAISLVLFLIKIVNPEIILKAATIIINVSIINITFLSTLRALKNDLFVSDQVETKIF